MSYTGQYYSHLIILCECENIAEVQKIPYKFRYARKICTPEHMSWFYAQLQQEDLQNKEIQEDTGAVDPLYECHQNKLKPYYEMYRASNLKELLMAIYNKLKI